MKAALLAHALLLAPAARGGEAISLGGQSLTEGEKDKAPSAPRRGEERPRPAGCGPGAGGSPSALSRIGAALVPGAAYTGGLSKIAFDCVNRVYLVVYGDPARGRFFDDQGGPAGGEFKIALEEKDYNGWTTVSFGEAAGDPVFLVTYISLEGGVGGPHPRFARLVRYRGGVGPRAKLHDAGDEWFASERGVAAWTGRDFVIGLREKVGGKTQPRLYRVGLDGKASAGPVIGDGVTYQGTARIACSPGGLSCLAIGFSESGTYGRLFDGRTLAPKGAVLKLGGPAREEDQNVVWNARAGSFLTAWHTNAGEVDARVVSAAGAPGPLKKGVFGPDAGDVQLSYNPGTGTTLLVSKWRGVPGDGGNGAGLYVLELGDDGAPLRKDLRPMIAPWDGKLKAWWPSVAADPQNGSWLVALTRHDAPNGQRVALVQSLSAGAAKAADDALKAVK